MTSYESRLIEQAYVFIGVKVQECKYNWQSVLACFSGGTNAYRWKEGIGNKYRNRKKTSRVENK